MKRPELTPKRHALLAKIHMARARVLTCPKCGRLFFDDHCPDHPELAPVELSDFAYREILKSIGSRDTCADMDLNSLAKVADLFDHAGYSRKYPYVSPQKEARRQRYGVIRQIRIRAPVVLGDTWESRVEGFCVKSFDKRVLEWLDMTELRKVIGWINRTEKYRR